MEVVEQLNYLVTNAEVMELLRDLDKEAQSAGFKRPPIARETSAKVCCGTAVRRRSGPRRRRGTPVAALPLPGVLQHPSRAAAAAVGSMQASAMHASTCGGTNARRAPHVGLDPRGASAACVVAVRGTPAAPQQVTFACDLVRTQVMEYLQTVPSCKTTSTEVARLMDKLNRFAPLDGQEPLRESEICNIANLRPTSVVALFAMIDKVRVRVRVMVHADVKSRVAICKLAEQGSRGFTQYVCVRVREIFAWFLVDSNGMCVHLHARPESHALACSHQSLERFGEEKLAEMLTVIASELTEPPPEDDAEAAGGGGG